MQFPNLTIAIGGSAGGLKGLSEILAELPEDFQATVLVCTHRSPDSKDLLKRVLVGHSRLEIVEPEDGAEIHCARVYVGRPAERVVMQGAQLDVSLDLMRKARLRLIDDLFESVAEHAGTKSVGVLLSGMLSDGVKGLQRIKAAGGRTVVQDPLDALYDSLPKQALVHVDLDFIGIPKAIAAYLRALADDETCTNPLSPEAEASRYQKGCF